MADKSFNHVVAQWIDGHRWPRDNPRSILVITEANPAGTVFTFTSAYDFFQIEATYNHDLDFLANVQLELDAPGILKPVTVAVVDTYHLSTSEGKPISFDIFKGYATGKVSFKYEDYREKQNIFVTYTLDVPSLNLHVTETINIAPTVASDAAADFTTAELKPAPRITPLGLKTDNSEQALLVKFLKDVVVLPKSVVVETHLPHLWEGDITFLRFLKLHGNVDPTTLETVGALYTNVPTLGRIRLAPVEGSLLGAGISVDVRDALAVGKATFIASKNEDGKYDLYVNADFDIKLHGKVRTDGKTLIHTFTF